MLYMALATVIVQQRTPGKSDVEFGKPGGYVAQNLQAEELEVEDEVEIEEEKIDPELDPIEQPKIKEDIDYPTDSEVPFVKTEVEERERPRQRHRKPNPHYEPRYNRDLALEQGGGSDKTEYAVIQALRWLAAHQNDDGSWGDPPVQPTLTGLALMCFLGHGEDHLSIDFGANVRNAITWFVEQQDDEGFLSKGMSWEYQNGVATYAMAEAYGMTGLDDLKPVVGKAIRRICEGQTPEGGWYYGYTKVRQDGTRWAGGDTSVCGWQIQALTAAWRSDIRFSDHILAEARRRAVDDIKSRFSRENGCGYQGTGPSRSAQQNYCTTAIGTLCLQFLGQWRSAEVRMGLDLMAKYECSWTKTTGGAGGPLYGWYYATQAIFQGQHSESGKRNWKRWNDKFSNMLVKRQEADGHWEYPEAGGKLNIRNRFGSPLNIKIYSTAMCCLMLEVYYRYLPTYRTPR
jgi:hypothetical protein